MAEPKGFQDRYIARGHIAKTADHLRDVKKGDVVYLAWTPESGGWYQWTKDMRGAYPFASASDCQREAVGCKGPWYYAPSPESLEVVEVTYSPPQDASIVIKAERQSA